MVHMSCLFSLNFRKFYGKRIVRNPNFNMWIWDNHLKDLKHIYYANNTNNETKHENYNLKKQSCTINGEPSKITYAIVLHAFTFEFGCFWFSPYQKLQFGFS